jgi:hypothetical protein
MQYETAVSGGLTMAGQNVGYVMAVRNGGGTEKPYEFCGKLGTAVHLLRWRAKANTLNVFQKKWRLIIR